MMSRFSRFGNDLHAGRRIIPIVGRRRIWYLIGAILILGLGTISAIRGPQLGIEFTGGSEFQITDVHTTDQDLARDVVRDHVPGNEPKITQLGSSTIRVQTAQLNSDQTTQIGDDLASAYGVSDKEVSSSFIGPVWGTDVTAKMARGVVVFLVLVAAVMALYFRDWKASLAAMIALTHDMLVTAAVYGVVGFEITPATVIGFLTILGYSLYDTIVVFDKVRENTADLGDQHRSTYGELVELAANQTIIRSINTSVVALLPVGAILGIGAFVLGAGTLKDISLALFVGTIAGTYSSIFLAPGLLVDLRSREPRIREHTAAVHARRAEARDEELVPVGVDAPESPDADDPEGDAEESSSDSRSRRGPQPRRSTRRRRTARREDTP